MNGKKCSDCLHYKVCSKWATVDLDKEEAWKYCYDNFRRASDYIILDKNILDYKLMLGPDKSVYMRELIESDIVEI